MMCIGALLCPILGMGGCAHAPTEKYEFSRVVMGVQARILLFAESEAQASSAAAGAFAVMAEIEDQTSDYRVDNVVASLARKAGTSGWIECGEHLLEMLRHGKRLGAESGGAFDVTMGPLSQVWREMRRTGREPDPAKLREAAALVDWRLIELDGSRARLARRGMRLDFGGIAKGYAAECAVRELKQRRAPRCLVSVAGDVFAGDPPPGKRGWRVAVQSGQHGSGVDDWIELSDAGCSTSGDVEQVVDVANTRRAHIIDLRTGLGSERRASVTVVAPHGWQSDALSTILYLSDEAAGQEVLNHYPRTRAIVYERGGDQVRRREINSAAERMSEMR